MKITIHCFRQNFWYIFHYSFYIYIYLYIDVSETKPVYNLKAYTSQVFWEYVPSLLASCSIVIPSGLHILVDSLPNVAKNNTSGRRWYSAWRGLWFMHTAVSAHLIVWNCCLRESQPLLCWQSSAPWILSSGCHFLGCWTEIQTWMNIIS